MPVKSVMVPFLLAIAFFALWAPPAHAYIDPTAAGAALQSLYLLLASSLMAIVLLPKKIAGLFAHLKYRLTGGKGKNDKEQNS